MKNTVDNQNKLILDPSTRPVLTVAEVASVLGVCKGAVYTLCHTEKFPAIQIGKRFCIPTARFITWLNSAPTIADMASEVNK